MFGLIWSASWPDKKDLFLKFLIWKNRKFSYDKLIFFLGKLYKKIFFALHFHYTGDSQYKVASLWTTRPDEISLFLKIEKSKKSIFFIEIQTFFYES